VEAARAATAQLEQQSRQKLASARLAHQREVDALQDALQAHQQRAQQQREELQITETRHRGAVAQLQAALRSRTDEVARLQKELAVSNAEVDVRGPAVAPPVVLHLLTSLWRCRGCAQKAQLLLHEDSEEMRRLGAVCQQQEAALAQFKATLAHEMQRAQQLELQLHDLNHLRLQVTGLA
jgi:ribosome-interacting GTPase 1